MTGILLHDYVASHKEERLRSWFPFKRKPRSCALSTELNESSDSQLLLHT